MQASGCVLLTVLGVILFNAGSHAVKSHPETDKTYLLPYVGRVYQLVSVCKNYEEVLQAMGMKPEKRSKVAKERPFYKFDIDGNTFVWTKIAEDDKDTVEAHIELGKSLKQGSIKSIFTAEKNVMKEFRTYQVESKKKELTIRRTFSDGSIILTIEIDHFVCPTMMQFVATSQELISHGIEEKELSPQRP